MAAAAIVVASSSFSARHGSLTVKRGHTVETRAATLSHSGAVSRKTFSKHDIDSTPKLVKKLYQGDDDRYVSRLQYTIPYTYVRFVLFGMYNGHDSDILPLLADLLKKRRRYLCWKMEHMQL